LEASIKRVVLIHWDVPEARARAARLEKLGYAADFYARAGPGLLRAIRQDPPSAVLIDLSRLPGQGRDVALELRANPETRQVPLVFVDGLPEKVLPVRQSLPDATFSTWTHLPEDLPAAIARPPRPVAAPQPAAPAAAPSGRTSAGKLGLQPNTVVALLSAPPGFEASLEPLPPGVVLRRQMSDDCDLVVWFVRSRRELQDGLPLRVARLAKGRLWILWPKKAASQSAELSAVTVRDLARANGLSEAKTASIEAAWSGVLLVRDA
jgi:CheY-like chemotaxis protein